MDGSTRLETNLERVVEVDFSMSLCEFSTDISKVVIKTNNDISIKTY